MTWGKLEGSIRTNGKVAEAGRNGALLYVALLALHTDKGRGGVIPASVCKPQRLRVEAAALVGTFSNDELADAIAACVAAELILVHETGAIELRGWGEQHAVACSHCRKPNPEPSHKTCPACREARKGERKSGGDKGARKQRAHGAKRAQVGANGAQLAALDSDSDSDSDNPPTPRAPCAPGERASARGASAARPDPEPEPRDPPAPPKPTPIADLTEALLKTRYRAGTANQIARRGLVRDAAATLAAAGATPANVAELARLAEAKSDGDPGALLAHWIDGGDWRGVLEEQAMKVRELGMRRPAGAIDDLLEGVYGGPPPAAVGDGIAAAVQQLAGGRP